MSPSLQAVSVADSQLMCRDSWINSIPFDDFVPFSCAKCFVQVFFNHKPLTIVMPPSPPYFLTHRNNSNLTYLPDPDSHGDQSVCGHYLKPDECAKWRECCQVAKQCCEESSNYSGYLGEK